MKLDIYENEFCIRLIKADGLGFMCIIDRGDSSHFPTNFDLTKKLFWVEYSYLAVITGSYQGPFTKISISVSLAIFEFFQIS